MWFFPLLLPCKTCTRRKMCWQREGTTKNKMKTILKGSESLVFVEHGRNKDFKLFVKLRRKRKTLYRRYCFINDYYMFARRTLRECHQWTCHCPCVCVRELAPKQVTKKRNVTSKDVTNSICSEDFVLFVFSHLLIYLQSFVIRTARCSTVTQCQTQSTYPTIQCRELKLFLLCLITRQNTNDHWP